jgi:hypothetical protein
MASLSDKNTGVEVSRQPDSDFMVSGAKGLRVRAGFTCRQGLPASARQVPILFTYQQALVPSYLRNWYYCRVSQSRRVGNIDILESIFPVIDIDYGL